MRPIHISGATAGWPVVAMDEPVAARSPGETLTLQAKWAASSRAWISARIAADGQPIAAID